jgi:phosphonate transport system permease protein
VTDEIGLVRGDKIRLLTRKGVRQYAVSFVTILILFLLSTAVTEFNPFSLLTKMENFWLFITDDLFPPKVPDLWLVLDGLFDTLCIAAASTFVTFFISIVAALAGSSVTGPLKSVRYMIRFLASLTRNIPMLIWTFILVMAFGIGTTVGIIALIINTSGFLTRSFIEIIDETGKDYIEAMKAVGAGYWATVFRCVIPTSMPGFVSWLLFALEINIRASTLVGTVGGGGIGLIMMGYLKSFRYHSALSVILMIAAVTIGVDILMNYLRKKVLA